MKKTLLFLLLTISIGSSAQIVNIPDANFKSLLLSSEVQTTSGSYGIDANNDGNIQVSEALAVIELETMDFIGESISTQGLEAFTNMKKIRIDIISPYVDFTPLTQLEEIESYYGAISAVNVSGLMNLKKLTIEENALSSLDVSGLTNLIHLGCRNNGGIGYKLSTLNLSGAVNLKSLNCDNNNLSVLDITGLSLLERLTCSENNLTALNVSNLPNLVILECYNNQIATPLDLSASTSIEIIRCFENQIPSLICNDLPNLEMLYCEENEITSLNLGHMPKLWMLNCNDNNLTSLDISGCPLLLQVMAMNNQISYINLKNGNPEILVLIVWDNAPGGLYLCVDEGEEAYIMAHADDFGLANLNSPLQFSTYCSFTPGGNYNTISGTFTFDADTNGCSASDALTHQVKLSINNGIQTGTAFNNQGSYNFYTQAGNFILTPQFENNWFTVTPPTATVNFANANNNTATQNFCIAPNGAHPDVEVVLVPQEGAQPGFDAYYKIIFKNKGNQTLSGSVVFDYDDAILDYVALGSTAPTSTASGQLTWAYSNLLPFESRTLNVMLNLNGPMETPPVNNDDVLAYSVSITPATGDETPADNIFTLNQVVTGSFDPNDITCLEGETVHPDKIGDYLHYNINFENTGTAPATFIVVKDVINAQQFDINSLQMMHASHNVETRINGNKVEFFFDDINLGPLAKGNVTFKIKTKPTVAINSTVMNKAEIFFDYNWPIETNEAETTFALLSAGDFTVDNSVSIYPNPAITNVTIKASSNITSVQLYDVQGRLLMATKDATFDVSNRTSGIYFVKVMTEKGMKVEKLIRK